MRRLIYTIFLIFFLFYNCEENRSSNSTIESVRIFDTNENLIKEVSPLIAPSGSAYLYNSQLPSVEVSVESVIIEPVTSAKSVSSVKVIPAVFSNKVDEMYNLDNLRKGENRFYIIIESEDLLSAKRYSINIKRK
ncbi:MAG: hypothetical protein WBG43_12475 [Marinifilaceae bacterium]